MSAARPRVLLCRASLQALMGTPVEHLREPATWSGQATVWWTNCRSPPGPLAARSSNSNRVRTRRPNRARDRAGNPPRGVDCLDKGLLGWLGLLGILPRPGGFTIFRGSLAN